MPSSIRPDPDCFRMPIQVRYLEADQQGVVFNAWYLAYFDEAVPAFLGHHGIDYQDLIAAGYDVMLVHMELDWLGSLRWPDRADVLVGLVALGRTSITLDLAVERDGEILVAAREVQVVTDPATHAPRAVPDFVRTALGPPRPLRRD